MRYLFRKSVQSVVKIPEFLIWFFVPLRFLLLKSPSAPSAASVFNPFHSIRGKSARSVLKVPAFLVWFFVPFLFRQEL